ncbi:6-phosphogluconolactonase [Nocardioides marmoriginsengisoli]|uniref:6-phosphogluconolactonase n=1 Tax=Nocardioides marmoriginsengisoli TaxID=661483 RepID=A0A3N0CA75_9ACTN|nr:6-phosphogluconolactonase [Nocardioides marmoriginsengisoli]RNL59936.1 6-phosphogluconolactonase [Nocardioides marmoriginsengisoli]
MRDVVARHDPASVADEVARRFLERMAEAQARGENPDVALTGGTVARLVHRRIAELAPEHAVDWTRITFWFGDERFVAADSPERNADQARADLLDAVGATRVNEVPASDQAGSAAEAADAYSASLRSEGSGEFDLVMLGMGPDGHVASLFPGAATLTDHDHIAAPVTDSPKPPPERVTLTFDALNRSRAVWFLVTGAEKAAATARAWAFEGTVAETPARGISGPSITWYVDQAAAGLSRSD